MSRNRQLALIGIVAALIALAVLIPYEMSKADTPTPTPEPTSVTRWERFQRNPMQVGIALIVNVITWSLGGFAVLCLTFDEGMRLARKQLQDLIDILEETQEKLAPPRPTTPAPERATS